MRKSSLVGVLLVLFVVLSSARYVMDDWEIPAKYKTMKNPQVGVEDDDEIGADLWALHCASCHGKTGAGDGKKAGELETEMNDFSESVVQKQVDGVLYYKSYIGRDEMPNFEKKIADEEERWLLINYMRTFAE